VYVYRFTSIVSGGSHILALTSAGRTFSMATDLDGNSHSQTGTRHPLPPGDREASQDIRWNTTLSPIPSLSSVNIAQLAAGLKSSYFRMADDSGRVLALGANTFGQLGLGSLASVEVVPVPSEVVLARSYPSGISVKCTNISAGEAPL
jgi:alpha-tubulin suppressor-like RCC1 family protein